MADYSEFPTTPTAWQEQHAQDWQTMTPLTTGEPVPPRRGPDLGALIPGVVFVVLAITLMAGVDLSLGLWENGGVLWLLLVGAGFVLLARELRKARHRRG